ncbi:hypothetical protein [Conexibacter arvalis]|uniref:Uncharacterized protein n=1 Tax=Conexibacter arvalis TaxID=912552 RepID=A0A840IDG7_9ACTN|nr:hypothetical protein [Conexibacter arvalis]MBB4662395.1 hypothetical protein [Conexibacter arvalis]
MTRVFLGWGALMAAIMLVGLLFVGLDDADSLALFGGTVAVMAAIAVVLALAGWGRALHGGVRALPDLSPPTVLLGVAIVLAALGAELGLWLALIGGGLALLAIGGLVREGRAQRRALARARAGARAGREGNSGRLHPAEGYERPEFGSGGRREEAR